MTADAQVPLPLKPAAVDAPWAGLTIHSDGRTLVVVEVTDMFVRIRFTEDNAATGASRIQHGVVTRRTWRVLAGFTAAEVSA